MKEELDKICCNCNHFISYEFDNSCQNGVCLEEYGDIFEEYFDDILGKGIVVKEARKLFNKYKSSSDNSCEKFLEMESIEIDDELNNSQSFLLQAIDEGKTDSNSIEIALALDYYNSPKINKEASCDKNAKLLKCKFKEDQLQGVRNLTHYATFDNVEAKTLLLDFLKNLQPYQSKEDIEFKCQVFNELKRALKDDERLLKIVVDDLMLTKSTPQTRKWYNEVFDFLKFYDYKISRPYLREMKKSKHFSYRMKNKIKEIIERETESWDY